MIVSNAVDDHLLHLLAKVAEMPFATDRELADCLGMQPDEVQQSLRKMLIEELIAYVPNAEGTGVRAKRYYLTWRGVLNVCRYLGCSAEELLHKMPVSLQWQRSLLRRLDGIVPFYRVVSEVSKAQGCEAKWRWFSSGALDGLMTTGGGRTLGLIRFGPTMSWKAMRSRLGTVYNGQRERRLPNVLLVVTGRLVVQRIAEELRGRAIRLHMAVEDDLIGTPYGSAVWRSSAREDGQTTIDVVDEVVRRRFDLGLHARARVRERLPASRVEEKFDAADLMSTEMSRQERRLLRVLFDWPLMRIDQLADVMAVSEGRLMNFRTPMVKKGLVFNLRIGETPEMRQVNGTRMCVSQEGLRYLGRLDRRRLGELMKHWSIREDGAGTPELAVQGYEMVGTKLRVLANELKHSDGMNDFVAMLAKGCREAKDWELTDLLPPHRWDRTFQYNFRPRRVRPDGTCEISYRGRRMAFMVEYEQRANIPARMDEKLERYVNYFGAMSTRGDFDRRQAVVLMVFPDSGTASRFVVFARRAVRRPLPVIVSSMDVLSEVGAIGTAWQMPWHMERGKVSLAAIG